MVGAKDFSRRLTALFPLAIFIALFFLPRLAFLNQEAINEENVFLLTSQFASAGFPLKTWAPIGICDGLQIREMPQHPVTHFAYFHMYGRLLGAIGIQPSDASFTFALRLFQLILISAALSLLVHRIIAWEFANSFSKQIAFVTATAAVLASPFFVGASIQLQFDGVIGTIPYVLILAALLNQKGDRSSKFFLFVCALLVGFDKPERLMLWIFSRALIAMFLPVISKKNRRPFKSYFPEIYGYLLGMIFLALLDLKDWAAFLQLTSHAAAGAKVTFAEYFKFSRHFVGLEYLIPVFLSAVIGIRILVKKESLASHLMDRNHEAITAISVFAILIFLSAFSIRFEGDAFARYYAPAMVPTAVLSCFAIVSSFTFDLKKLVPFILSVIAIAVVNRSDLLAMRGHSITSVYSLTLAPVVCPVIKDGDRCISQIPYECVKVGYSANFVLHDNADAVGNQCRIPVCPLK